MRLVILAFVYSGLASATAPAQMPMPAGEAAMHRDGAPVKPSGPLVVRFGDKQAEWPTEKLASLPHATITVFNAHTKQTETYSGVPLIDLLTPLGFPDKPHGADFKLYVAALGADGYCVVYSGGEITPDVHDATILVADTQDGKPLTDDGPLKIVATGEKRPGRWVRNLTTIVVHSAE